ncbi:MAG: hypothetical protein Q9M91_06505 [Candidatus Dojkabacteria bacterium]|nr:hypothetical protein [Candidatus Dojkabacteria bacterium]MDQ7021447.1 hypothetical protein [Candidatus Dojkabacteria bacterium]
MYKGKRVKILALLLLVFISVIGFFFLSSTSAKSIGRSFLLDFTNPEVSATLENCRSSEAVGIVPDFMSSISEGGFINFIDGIKGANQNSDLAPEDCGNIELLATDPKAVNYIYGYLNGTLPESQNRGLVLSMQNLTIELLEQRPASSRSYVEQQVYALSNFGSVNAQNDPSVYYPGTGYSLLKPIQAFWGWSVNVVYGILIFLIVGVAFAIMFRARLSGGASVTIQSAIPNIALAMILVPLSYPISAVFIDIVTAGTDIAHEFLVGNGSPARVVYDLRNCSKAETRYLETKFVERSDKSIYFLRSNDATVAELNSGGAENCKGKVPKDSTGNPIDRGLYANDDRLVWYNSAFQVNIAGTLDDSLTNISTNGGPLSGFLQFSVFVILARVIDFFGGFGGTSAGTGASDSEVVSFWFAQIINFLITILLFITSFRIFKKLIEKYIIFVIFPIFSPFFMATVAVPGNGTKAIMDFLKMMWSASIIYITTYLLFLLAIILSNESFAAAIPASAGTVYIPPMSGLGVIAGYSDDVFAGVNGFMMAIMAVAIYLNIPVTLQQIDDELGTQIKVPKFFTNAFNSAKDSVNLAKQSIDYGKQGINKAGGLANSTSVAFTGRKLNGADGILSNAYRKQMGGIRQFVGAAKESQGDGTVLGDARAAVSRLTARTAGNLLLGVVNAAESNLGGEGTNSRSQDPDKPRALKVEFKGPGVSGGTITLTQDNLLGILGQFGAIPDDFVGGAMPLRSMATNEVLLKGFKVSFTAENYSFGSVVSKNDIVIAEAKSRGTNNAATVFRRTANGFGGPYAGINSEIELYPGIPTNINPPGTGQAFDFASGGVNPQNVNAVGTLDPRTSSPSVHLLVANRGMTGADPTPQDPYPTVNGQSFAIKVDLVFRANNWNDVVGLMGRYSTTAQKFLFTDAPPILSPAAAPANSRPLVFKIGGVVSNGDQSKVNPLTISLITQV